uniref:Uncharacterized protein n=1 Tax=uncultured marine virus TaxID=186617 RepID=A0A0F7LAC6_9VIRU|nr:hypothetical protein Daro_3619 [uncultured marine virus]
MLYCNVPNHLKAHQWYKIQESFDPIPLYYLLSNKQVQHYLCLALRNLLLQL